MYQHRLNLSNNQMESLPNIHRLSGLEELIVNNNLLNQWPELMENLTKYVSINEGDWNRQLNAVDWFYYFISDSLRMLQLNGNKIPSIPATIIGKIFIQIERLR